jgi:hypothetical protein
MRKLAAVILLFGPASMPIATAYTIPPGDYSHVGRIASVSKTHVELENDGAKRTFILKKPDDAAILKPHVGAWVKMDYRQTNFAGYRTPNIEQPRITRLFNDDAAFPLHVEVRAKKTLTFGEPLSVDVRITNVTGRTIALDHVQHLGREPGVVAELHLEGKVREETTLVNSRDHRFRLEGVSELRPKEIRRITLRTVNLLLPGRYKLSILSPYVKEASNRSEPVEVEIVALDRDHSQRTLLEWMDKPSSLSPEVIAWILWRDFGSRKGVAKLIDVMETDARPRMHAAGVVAAVEGEKGIEPFLRSLRKGVGGQQVQYWAEFACHSPVREKLFLTLLKETTRTPYHELKDEPVPISHLVGRFLLYYVDEKEKFPWDKDFEERQKVVDRLIKLIETKPDAIRLFKNKVSLPINAFGEGFRENIPWGTLSEDQ